jgi:glycosyltransferase involved in cell wall biosynthesis
MSKNIPINVIAPNIKSGGGKELLEYLLLYLDERYRDINIIVYIDSSLTSIMPTNRRSVIRLSNTIDKIKLFFRKIDNGIYFGNLPPIVRSTNSMVYFHNRYLLLDSKSLYRESFSLFIKYSLQKIYINYFIRNVDFVGCQNKKIKKDFVDKYNFTNVELLPFYGSCNQKNQLHEKIYDFCYVSLAYPHKNHKLLFEALEILGKKRLSISVVVTIQEEKKDLINQLNQINTLYKIKIINLGEITKEEVCALYEKTKCMIFPSTIETFGLGLVEAVEMGLDVIAADLSYTHEAISTSFLFNPESAIDCAREIERYLNDEFPKKSSKIIENSIESLITKFNRSSNV